MQDRFVGSRERYGQNHEIVSRFLRENEKIVIAGRLINGRLLRNVSMCGGRVRMFWMF
jgi:hypothetical protein